MTITDKGVLYLIKLKEGSNLCWKTTAKRPENESDIIISFRLNDRIRGSEKSETVENGTQTNTTIIIGQFIKSLKPNDVLTILKFYNI